MRFAVFDFDAAACRELADTVRAFCARDGTGQVEEYSAISPLAYAARDGRHDLVFLTVESVMGAEAARLVRESAPDCPLVFVGEDDGYALEGFRLHALDYLVRPVTAERVGEAVMWVLRQIGSA